MNKYLIKKNKIGTFFVVILFIQCKTIEVQNKNGDINDAILNSIYDFINDHKSLTKNDRVFYVGNERINDYYLITISRTLSKHLYNPSRKPSDNILPSNFYEVNNKLFIWWDDQKEVDETTIQTYLSYDLLIDNQNDTIVTLDVVLDDKTKGVSYYICKNDLSNYKKIKSSYVKNSHPKLKCN